MMLHNPLKGIAYLLRKLKKQPHTITTNDFHKEYVGSWHFIDQTTQRTHQLTITEQAQLYLDTQPLPGQIITISDQELVFLDHYGYQLKIEANNRIPYTIFDEAEDKTYPIIAN